MDKERLEHVEELIETYADRVHIPRDRNLPIILLFRLYLRNYI